MTTENHKFQIRPSDGDANSLSISCPTLPGFRLVLPKAANIAKEIGSALTIFYPLFLKAKADDAARSVTLNFIDEEHIDKTCILNTEVKLG